MKIFYYMRRMFCRLALIGPSSALHPFIELITQYRAEYCIEKQEKELICCE